ncbi:MAG: peptidoglycan editing factor PgeF [Candidatus Eisenbacteria bacterium]|nr:peptidoglycan editing factor PgeF [Candidatus Eisenbacteria bacterium]
MNQIPPDCMSVPSLGDGVLAFFSTSLSLKNSSSRPPVTHPAMLSSLGLDPGTAAYGKQVHGSTVKVVSSPGNQGACDSLVTPRKGILLATFVADCAAVLLFDKRNKAIANVHAGWRGALAGITRKTVESMENKFKTRPEDLSAYISPSIGSCCYTVGSEVADLFDGTFVHTRDGKLFLDLWSLNKSQLEASGVTPDRIHVSGICTCCNPDLFHSYRRDGPHSGRMVSVIGLVSSA